VVAITGAHGRWGQHLVHALAASGQFERVVALDRKKEPGDLADADERVTYRHVDLAVPGSDARLADVLKREKVDVIVHGAYVQRPRHQEAQAHDLDVIGTMHVLSAATSAAVRKLVFMGSTMCYGAHPSNPNFLTEHAPLRGMPGFAFVQDKLEAETQVTRYCATRPEMTCTVLRLCPVLGPTLQNVWSLYLRGTAAPGVLGFDPLMQFLHPEDAVRAVRLAALEDHPGAFNIVGRGVLPLSTVLRMAGTIPVPMPRGIGRTLVGALWATQFSIIPPHLLDYLTYVYVADGEKAAQQMGFIPQYNTREAVLNLVGVSQQLAGAVTA